VAAYCRYRRCQMTPKSFKDSQEAGFRRMVRDAIRRGPFTKSERDVTLAVVNHWFHHKGGPQSSIRPGRDALAKKAGVSVRTVASVLSMLRTIEAIEPVTGLNGGYLHGGRGMTTHYTVNPWPLMVFCGCDWVDDFMRGSSQNCTVSGGVFARFWRAKIAHCSYDVGTSLSQGGETDE